MLDRTSSNKLSTPSHITTLPCWLTKIIITRNMNRILSFFFFLLAFTTTVQGTTYLRELKKPQECPSDVFDGGVCTDGEECTGDRFCCFDSENDCQKTCVNLLGCSCEESSWLCYVVDVPPTCRPSRKECSKK